MNVKWLISSSVLSWIYWSMSASNTFKAGHRQPDWQHNLSASHEKVGPEAAPGGFTSALANHVNASGVVGCSLPDSIGRGFHLIALKMRGMQQFCHFSMQDATRVVRNR